MERGVGAIQSLPSSAIIYWSLLNRAWKLLKEDGIILAQIPYKSHVSNSKVRIKEWIKQLNDKGIKASYKDFPFKNGNMVLERNPDSPDNLPTLPKTELT